MLSLYDNQVVLSQDDLMKRKHHKKQLLLIIGLAVVYIVLNFATEGKLLRSKNLTFIISHSVFPGIVALGMSFFFTAGIVDLSVGANIILSSNIGNILATKYELGYIGFVLITILCAVIIGQITINCSVTLNIPSWIAGLGMALIYEAILAQYVYSNKIMGILLPDELRGLGQFRPMLMIFIVSFLVAYLLFNKTSIGMKINAIGGNSDIAETMGIDRKRTIIIGSLIGGVFIGMGAVVQMSYSGRMDATTGVGSLGAMSQALAIVLLSGSIRRIFSSPVAILISSIFVLSIFNVLTLLGVPSGTGQEMFLGTIMILTGILSRLKYKGMVK